MGAQHSDELHRNRTQLGYDIQDAQADISSPAIIIVNYLAFHSNSITNKVADSKKRIPFLRP